MDLPRGLAYTRAREDDVGALTRARIAELLLEAQVGEVSSWVIRCLEPLPRLRLESRGVEVIWELVKLRAPI